MTGNHEIYLGAERALAVARRAGIRVLEDEMTVIDGLQIVGVGYPRRGEPKDNAAAVRGIAGFDPGRPSILLYHSPVQIPEVKAAGVRLQISGHTHHGQIFPVGWLTRLIYGRYYRGLNEEDGIAVYTSPGTGAWGPAMRTGNTPEVTVIRLKPR